MVKLGVPQDEQSRKAAAARPQRRRRQPRAARARIVDGQPARRCRSTKASTAPGAASAWRSTAAASRSKTATAPAACTSCATSIRPTPARKSRASGAALFGSKDEAVRAGALPHRAQERGRARRTVSVLNAQGAPENGDAGQRIVALLADDLK